MAFNWLSPSTPPVASVPVPVAVLVSVVPLELVKSVTRPVDRITPESVGEMPGVVVFAPE